MLWFYCFYVWFMSGLFNKLTASGSTADFNNAMTNFIIIRGQTHKKLMSVCFLQNYNKNAKITKKPDANEE